MGRKFIEHLYGCKPVLCGGCSTPLSTRDHLESTQYQGSTGKAYLYTKAVNLEYTEVQERNMMTGKHYVRDINCKVCKKKLGWMYEFAVPESQRHKEGKVILEQACIRTSIKRES